LSLLGKKGDRKEVFLRLDNNTIKPLSSSALPFEKQLKM
jgi:hypothetical protein